MTLETKDECLAQLNLLREDSDITKEDLLDLIDMMIQQDNIVLPLDDMIEDRGLTDELL